MPTRPPDLDPVLLSQVRLGAVSVLATQGPASFADLKALLKVTQGNLGAHLARLELDPAESAAMLVQLNGFFRIVEQMGAVDTRGVEPLYTPLAAVQAAVLRLRDDAVTEYDERALNQASAPAVEDGLFLVPKVIE